MGTYENGVGTRRLILNACRKLFLEKGFHETSYDDICRAAHVNRGSIYYHFKEKENIRYEVSWELMYEYRKYVNAYCPDAKHEFTLALYVLWEQFLCDPRVQKFFLDYFKDQPIYSPASGAGRFYRILYEQMYGELWPLERVDELAFASIYGHISALMLFASETNGTYSVKRLFHHSFCVVAAPAWGIPKETALSFWKEVEREIDLLPADRLAEQGKTGNSAPVE